MLNHLYVMKNRKPHEEEEEGDDVMILGSTQRYRTKFVTYVLYKPAQDDSDSEDWEIPS
jgi:hypothetical protein